MAYGITCYNDGGQLTLSAESITYGYIGKATYASTVPAGTDPTIAYNGYTTYTITWAGPILVALPVLTGATTSLLGTSQVGSTWTIQVFCSGGTVDSFGFDSQRIAEVFVFGKPVSVSGYGMALYNAASQLTCDLSRRPLATGQFVSFTATEVLKPLTGYTKPAFIGGDTTEVTSTAGPTGGLWTNRERAGGWLWDSGGTQLSRPSYQTARIREDMAYTNTTTRWPVDVIIIEASGLT